MKRLLALIFLPLGLMACGQASEDAPTAAPSSTSALPATTASTATTAQPVATLPPSSAEPGQAPTLTAVPTTATTEAPAPTVNEATEDRVRKVLERYRAKYADVLADLEASGMPMTEYPIAEEIANACAAGPDGIADDPSGNAFAAMLFTPILADHGLSWPEFMRDAAKANLEIQEIAGC